MGTLIAEFFVKSTVMIELGTLAGISAGTGFFTVRINPADEARAAVYLVTNKHVLSPTNQQLLAVDATRRAAGQTIRVHGNVKTATGHTGAIDAFSYTPDEYREHPNVDVDVAVINFTRHVLQTTGYYHQWLDFSIFADGNFLREHGISPGDEVLTIGYPLGFLQGASNSPIVRQGVLATSVFDDLSGTALIGRPGALPAFLIDGGALPGSSGSPVVLKPVVGRNVDGKVRLDPLPPYLLGILAETRFAQIPGTGQTSFAGLGMAFRTETIRKTIEQFPMP